MGWNDDPDADFGAHDEVVKAAPKAKATPYAPSATEAFFRGGGQGVTLGFGDEANGAIQALGERFLPEALGGGGEQAKGKSFMDLFRGNRDSFRREDKAAEQAHDKMYLAGNVLGGAVAAPVLPGGQAKTFGQLVKAGAALGGAAGLGNSDADLTTLNPQQYGQAALDTTVGMGLGGAAGALGSGIQKGAGWVGGKMAGRAATRAANAEAKAAEIGAMKAAELTATERSAAGRAAQDAYKQLEHLRELGAMRSLTPDETAMVQDLTQELAAKTRAKLPGSVALKDATAERYGEALATESQRAAERTTEELTPRLGKHAWELFRSYGEPVIGATVGGYVGDKLGGHGMAGGGLGTLGGLILGRTRAGKAIANRYNHPGNQVALANALRGLGNAMNGSALSATESALARSPAVGSAAGSQAVNSFPALASLFGLDDEKQKQLAMAQALATGGFDL